MQTLKLVLIGLLLWLGNAQAQIGSTLAQCHKHFGHEINPGYTSLLADTGPGVVTFGVNYHHYTREREPR